LCPKRAHTVTRFISRRLKARSFNYIVNHPVAIQGHSTPPHPSIGGEFLVSSDTIVHVTDASFEEDVVKAKGPILLDFWAEWCGPCKMIAPMLNEIATEYKEKVTIAKLNIDENPKTPQRFNVRGIPTLILFKNGQVEGQKVGALRKSDLAAFLDSKL